MALGNHSMAIKPDSTLWGWGQNNNSQIGDGTTTNVTTPKQITSEEWRLLWDNIIMPYNNSLIKSTNESLSVKENKIIHLSNPTQDDYINYGINVGTELNLDDEVTTHVYVDSEGNETIVEEEPKKLKDILGDSIFILHYTDDEGVEESVNTIKTEPFTIYDECGSSLEVLHYTDEEVEKKDLHVTADYSPLDEFTQDFTVHTLLSDGENADITYTGTPTAKIAKQANKFPLIGEVKNMIASDTSSQKGIVRYLFSFNNGANYEAFKDGVWATVDHTNIATVKSIGMTAIEINELTQESLNLKPVASGVKIAYLLKESIYFDEPAIVSPINYVTSVGLSASELDYVNVYATNTMAKVELTLTGMKLNGTLSDVDGSRVQYRVLLNEQPLYLGDGSFTMESNSPTIINFNIPSNKVIFDQDNEIKVEFKDSWGNVDYWTATFFGQFYGLIIKDKDGQPYTDPNGAVLRHLDFGVIIAGQITLPQKIKVENTYGYDLQNVRIRTLYDYDNPKAIVEISPTEEPFVAHAEYTIGDLPDGETVELFTRVHTKFDATPMNLANFKLQVVGDKVE